MIIKLPNTESTSMASPNKKSRLSESNSENETELDRISDLPGNVIDRILSCLSTKESAKTSILSTKWRHRWETVPSLVFDDEFFTFNTDDLVAEIGRVLLLHAGLVHKFELSHSQSIPQNAIDTWILYLSRGDLQDLVLKIPKPGCYHIPGCLFSCRSLASLEITCCVLKPPSTFKGFENLTSLDIDNVFVTKNVLENLISSSPVLENLVLGNLNDIDRLNIDAPNLHSFEHKGPFLDVSLENSPRLAEFFMHTTTCHGKNYRNGRIGNDSNLLNLMAGMNQLGSLTIHGYYLVYLAEGDIPKELPIHYINLISLSVSIDFTVSNEIKVFLCLLRSSPNLKELQIDSCWDKMDETISNIWDSDGLTFAMSRLRLVEMRYFRGARDEIEFVKSVLLISPALESITVELESGDENWDCGGYEGKFEIVKNMLRLKRASAKAEIIFLDSKPQQAQSS